MLLVGHQEDYLVVANLKKNGQVFMHPKENSNILNAWAPQALLEQQDKTK